MNLNIGDILHKGKDFYRIYNIGKDIVINRVFYNPKTDKLQIFHAYEHVEWREIYDNSYTILYAEDSDTKSKLEILKRKHKLEKLNNLNS